MRPTILDKSLDDIIVFHNGKPIKLPLTDILSFEEETMHEDMMNYSYIAVELAKICEDERRNYEMKKIEFEEAFAKAYTEIKSNEKDGNKSLSDVRVNNFVESMPEIVNLKKELVELQTNYKFIEHILRAYSFKRDMIYNFAATVRKLQ